MTRNAGEPADLYDFKNWLTSWLAGVCCPFLNLFWTHRWWTNPSGNLPAAMVGTMDASPQLLWRVARNSKIKPVASNKKRSWWIIVKLSTIGTDLIGCPYLAHRYIASWLVCWICYRSVSQKYPLLTMKHALTSRGQPHLALQTKDPVELDRWPLTINHQCAWYVYIWFLLIISNSPLSNVLRHSYVHSYAACLWLTIINHY